MLTVVVCASSSFAYYNSEQGRWISRDPIQESGGVNIYGFTGNNPVGAYDLLGLKSVEIERSAEEKKCKCCCAESISAVNLQQGTMVQERVRGFNKQYQAGHFFTARVQLQYLDHDTNTGDCSLEWFEKSNIPFYPPQDPKYPGKWRSTDMYALMLEEGRNTRIGQAWNSHGPSRPLVFLPDRPSVNIMTGKGDTKRTLKIKIKVTSAKDCGCANKSVELEIEQKLVVESYRPVWDKSYLEINGKKHDFK